MNLKFIVKIKTFVALVGFAMLISALQNDAFARPIKLRANINPGCATTSTLKYADIYAEGNIAVMGSYNCRGAFIFNISNPDAPTLASWYNPSPNQQFLEAIVVNGRGYFGSGTGGGGVHIVDLTNPSNPVFLGAVNSTSGNGHNTIHEMMVFVQNGQTYLIENSNSLSNKILKVINVTNPAAPVFVRDINPTEPQWIHAMHIRGNRMFTSGWGNSTNRGRTEIYDITNIGTQAPTLLGFIEDATSITSGNSMHSSWTSEDGNYLYSCRETSASNSSNPADLRVYNISNPAQPLMVNKISMVNLGINAVSPHNPVVMGNKLYISWYQAGTQIFDISEPANPRKIGEYDTYLPQYAPKTNANGELYEEPWDMVCGLTSQENVLPTNYEGNWAVYPFLGENKVLLGDLTTGLYIVDATLKNQVSDFDGDGKTDFSTFTPNSGNWNVEMSSNNSSSQTNFGLAEDKIVGGDYDGDGKTDMAVFRPSTGTWWIRRSSNPGNFLAVNFGVGTDVPVEGDYDGDAKTDIAVFRPATGVWYILQSTGGVRIIQWGVEGDKAFSGDYDGDGKADLGIFRNGDWYILRSATNSAQIVQFGLAGDLPVVGNFDNDEKADIVVYRPSTGVWYMLKSSDNSFSAQQFGLAEDLPIPGDYDGDGKSDVAVYRPSTSGWYRLNSTNGAFSARTFGANGDVPSPRSMQP